MRDLPAPLARPLHILEPWPWKEALGWLLAGVVLFLLVRRWIRWRRRRQATRSAPAPGTTPLGGFSDKVESIRSQARESGRFRQGCHELALLLRGTLAPPGSGNLDTLTARETERRLGDGALTRLLVLLADLRFGRRAPDEGDLDTACQLAIAVERQMPKGRR